METREIRDADDMAQLGTLLSSCPTLLALLLVGQLYLPTYPPGAGSSISSIVVHGFRVKALTKFCFVLSDCNLSQQ